MRSDLELAVVGCALSEPYLIDRAAGLAPDDFADPARASVWRAMKELTAAGQAVTALTVAERAGVPVGTVLEAELRLPDSEGFARYVQGVMDASTRDRLARVLNRAVETEDIQAALALVAEEAHALASRSGNDGASRVGDIARQVVVDLGDDDIDLGVPTGIRPIDKLIFRMGPGQLLIVAGRPGTGKSALAGAIADNVASTGRGVLVVSLEMSRAELVQRQLAARSGLDSDDIRRRHLGRESWVKLIAAAKGMESLPMYIEDRIRPTMGAIQHSIRRHHAEGNLALVVVDYLQLVHAGGKRGATRNEEIGQITGAMKAMARVLRIPIMVLSQLNRDVEKRAVRDQRPKMSDLRDSGAIEADADTILFIHRPSADGEPVQGPGLVEVSIGKQRSGATGVARLYWTPSTMTYSEMR